MPRLTIVTQWYPPEPAPYGRMMQELARGLTDCGWDVTVITGYPNHPAGKLYAGYRRRWLEETRVDGVRVCRSWLALPRKRTPIARLATFVTFTLLAGWRILRRPRPDVIFAVLQPLSMGLMLPRVARFKGAPLVFNLQDLHPAAQVKAGMVRNRVLIKLLETVERHAYEHCDALSVICDAFRQHVVLHGANRDHVSVIGNWIDTERIYPDTSAGAGLRRELGISPDAFLILTAGTLGHASGAAVIIETATLLREERRIRFLIVGEGPVLESIKDRARSLRLENVSFLPFQNEERLLAVQNAADVSLVTLAPGFAGVSVPSKLLAYLAAGKPVIASVPETSETAQVLQRAACGLAVPADDASALSDAIRSLARDPQRAARMGVLAREFAVGHLSLAAAVARYDRLFRTLCPT